MINYFVELFNRYKRKFTAEQIQQIQQDLNLSENYIPVPTVDEGIAFIDRANERIDLSPVIPIRPGIIPRGTGGIVPPLPAPDPVGEVPLPAPIPAPTDLPPVNQPVVNYTPFPIPPNTIRALQTSDCFFVRNRIFDNTSYIIDDLAGIGPVDIKSIVNNLTGIPSGINYTNAVIVLEITSIAVNVDLTIMVSLPSPYKIRSSPSFILRRNSTQYIVIDYDEEEAKIFMRPETFDATRKAFVAQPNVTLTVTPIDPPFSVYINAPYEEVFDDIITIPTTTVTGITQSRLTFPILQES